MHRGTKWNILTELGITGDQYGLITVIYTASHQSNPADTPHLD